MRTTELITEAQLDVVKPLTEWQVAYLQRGDVDKALLLQNSIEVVNRLCGALIAYDDTMIQLTAQFDVLRQSSYEAFQQLQELKEEIEQNKFFIQK